MLLHDLTRAGVLFAVVLLPRYTAALELARPAHSGTHTTSAVRTAGVDIVGTVTDSASGQPLAGAEISVSQASRVVFNTSADAFGRYAVHNLGVGSYVVSARFLGFRLVTRSVTLSESSPTINVSFQLASVATNLQAVEVTAKSPIAIDTRTGDQTFKESDYHGAPTTTTSQILQQSIASSVRAPTGEVHIRGQHAEYTYYIDGVPVPAGVSGSLNELFDPQVVNRIDFQTGGWDAEYGNKNIAIVNIQTRIPTGGFHSTLSGYTGSFGTAGGSLTASTNSGPFGLFVSGTSQTTDMRREPVVVDTFTKKPINFHNSGHDQFGFVKMQFTPSTTDVMTLELNASRTHFQVPYDSSGATTLDDRQTDLNSFANLGYRHLFGAGAVTDETAPSELFIGAFYRHGSLVYIPGAKDVPRLTYGTDTITTYNVAENRAFNAVGTKIDYTTRVLSNVTLKVGALASQTSGHENFSLTDPTGTHPPIASISGLNGYDLGGYAQSVLNFTDRFEVRAGLRYDSHVAPFAGNQHQISPRIRLNFFPDAANTLYLYYGRLFVPTNIEDLRSITASAQQNQATIPTLPERDNYYEAGVIHRFPVGIVTKVSGYYKQSSPGIDDNTVPGSSITTSVNLHDVKITGLETVLEVQPAGPLSGYLNASIIHAYGNPPVYGGFFFLGQPNNNYFDLDHDQRVSIVGGLTYSVSHFYVSTTGIYGSGLTNGITPDSSVHVAQPGVPAISSYCTGLFCMNTPFKVAPNYIQNVSAGYSFVSGGTVLRPEVFIDNVFDRRYLLKGAFFSGASAGRPRSVQVRMNVSM
jgi:outer membrane receptor for ferrienterochelin and colicin